MRASVLLSSVLLSTFLVGGCEMTAPPPSTDEYALDPVGGDHGIPEPPMLGVHAARGAGGGGGGTSNPQLVYKGGNIMSSVQIQPIFWGTSWATDTSDKMPGIAQFYRGFIGSAYAGTNTEYTGIGDTIAGAYVTSTNITYTDSLIDSAAAPRTAPKTSDILAEVCNHISTPAANGYYPVYTDTPRGHAGYCAWHSWGACNGVNVQFAFFFKLDGDPGCDPQDPDSTKSQGLEALANVTGHELSEAVTDPRGNGWVDSGGSENADKCAWVFPSRETFSDNSTWLVQGNWSDAAYTAGTGYANRSGQLGCINGN